MNFVTLTSVSNQTVVITPRYSGQIVRVGSQEVVTTAGEEVRVFGSGSVDVSEGWWDDLTIVDGDYSGPSFDGNTAPQSGNLSTVRTSWMGLPDRSESLYETRPVIGSDTNLFALQAGPWIGGQGHSGCRFVGVPTYVSNSPYAGGRIGFAASFTEVGSWVYG